MKLRHELALFIVGGGIGFVVDAGIVQYLVRGLGWNPYLARVLSFAAAASVTWWWNRRVTFARHRSQQAHAEWLRWMLAMSAGAALNYGIYALLVWLVALVRAWPLLGVAAGSLVAAGVNFVSARRLVFNSAKKPL